MLSPASDGTELFEISDISLLVRDLRGVVGRITCKISLHLLHFFTVSCLHTYDGCVMCVFHSNDCGVSRELAPAGRQAGPAEVSRGRNLGQTVPNS